MIKPHQTQPHSSRRSSRGQAMIEYVVVTGALAFALLYPIKDEVSPDKPRTAAQIMIEGFRTAYRNISASLSIPD